MREWEVENLRRLSPSRAVINQATQAIELPSLPPIFGAAIELSFRREKTRKMAESATISPPNFPGFIPVNLHCRYCFIHLIFPAVPPINVAASFFFRALSWIFYGRPGRNRDPNWFCRVVSSQGLHLTRKPASLRFALRGDPFPAILAVFSDCCITVKLQKIAFTLIPFGNRRCRLPRFCSPQNAGFAKTQC